MHLGRRTFTALFRGCVAALEIHARYVSIEATAFAVSVQLAAEAVPTGTN